MWNEQWHQCLRVRWSRLTQEAVMGNGDKVIRISHRSLRQQQGDDVCHQNGGYHGAARHLPADGLLDTGLGRQGAGEEWGLTLVSLQSRDQQQQEDK